MKTIPLKIIQLNTIFTAALLCISCIHDSDLLTEHVLADARDEENTSGLIVDDYFETDPDNSVVLDVLANDTFTSSDNVKIVQTSIPESGSVKINEEDNTLTYTPSSEDTTGHETNDDSFTYTVEIINEDQTVSTEIGTVEIVLIDQYSANLDADLLFKSGFEGVTISKVFDYQYIRGTDASSSFSWPIDIWGSSGSGIHRIHDGGGSAIDNKLEVVTGHKGSSTTTLFQRVNHMGGSFTQTPYQINNISNDPEELYIKYWMKVDNTSLSSNGDWRALWEYKSDDWHDHSSAPGFRMISFIGRGGNGDLYWRFQGDDNPSNPIWGYEKTNSQVPVKRNEWFQVEYYVRLSHLNDGIAWMKVDGQIIGEHKGANLGNADDTMSFMMLTQVYGNSTPMHQWVDDIEIWDGMPN